jgi:hypothetical protein
MSIAVAISVHDGVVLAADSASTLASGLPGMPPGVTGPAQLAVNVYNNANKIANLCKGAPIGCVAHGSGSIGSASISTLLKDFREQLMTGRETSFDRESYTIESVSQLLSNFLAEQIQRLSSKDPRPTLGIMVAGYSAEKTPGELRLGEVWTVGIQGGVCSPPQNMRLANPVGISWAGATESLSRLLMGFSPVLPQLLQVVTKPRPSPQDMTRLMEFLGTNLTAPVVFAPMPIQDTIDLAEWLVQTAIMYSRFSPGAPIVGGPIESAAITKHEGFKWIRRKHYFKKKFNEEVGHEQLQHGSD